MVFTPAVHTMTYTREFYILIIDDNCICSAILKGTIKKLQSLFQDTLFVITTLSSAEEALKNLVTATYDLIFTDIEMGEVSGDKMARIIRDMSPDSIYMKNRGIPIYAVTARHDEESHKQYKKAGITGTLAKPAKKECIYAIIENMISQIMISP